MNNQKNYRIEENVVIITDGGFKGLQFTISDFESSEGKLKYNYKIISGDVQINEGEEFKNLIKSVVDDIIYNYGLEEDYGN
jgi:hypothetical protein